MTSINQEMMNKANTKCDAYEAPHLTIIPLRASGMLCLSAGDVYQNAMEVNVLDFEKESNVESEAIRNGQFTDWSNNNQNSFF